MIEKETDVKKGDFCSLIINDEGTKENYDDTIKSWAKSDIKITTSYGKCVGDKGKGKVLKDSNYQDAVDAGFDGITYHCKVKKGNEVVTTTIDGKEDVILERKDMVIK